MSKLVITGGTGSFGKAVLKRYLQSGKFSEITVFSRDEKKQTDLFNELQTDKVRFIIGDVRDLNRVYDALEGADTVFHAAALKHVPTGEFFPLEVVKTNILGSDNVFRAANEKGVKKVILLSTDKAVYPVNAMGMSKAMAEKLMTSYSRNNSARTVYCAVRYGNVMASRGSVIPLFVEQIKKGKDLTITNPNMTRFLLSLDDSIDLVETAMTQGEQGSIFIKKAPSCTIKTLAEALLEIFGSKQKIQLIGVRKGEKIHETLATGAELAAGKDEGSYFHVSTNSKLDYDQYFKKGKELDFPEDYTSENTKKLNRSQTIQVLMKLRFINESLNDMGTSLTRGRLNQRKLNLSRGR